MEGGPPNKKKSSSIGDNFNREYPPLISPSTRTTEIPNDDESRNRIESTGAHHDQRANAPFCIEVIEQFPELATHPIEQSAMSSFDLSAPLSE